VITNMYQFQQDEFLVTMEQAKSIMQAVTGLCPVPDQSARDTFSFGKSGLVAVNSKPVVSVPPLPFGVSTVPPTILDVHNVAPWVSSSCLVWMPTAC